MNDSLDLRQYIALGFKWWWLLVLAGLVGAGAGYAVSQRQPRIYQATAKIIVGQSIQATDLTSADILTSERLAQTYANMARLQPVLQAVVDTLSLSDSWKSLKDRVTVTPIRDTQLLEITVQAVSPEEARVTADEVAHQLILRSPTALQNQEKAANQQFVRQRLESLQGKIESGQAHLQELEASMIGSLSAEQVQQIQAEINELEKLIADWENNYTQLLIFVEGNKSPNYLAVVEPAQAGLEPISPRVSTNTLLAGVVGLLLALGLIFLIEYLDDTLKSPGELSQALGLTVLGNVSQIGGKNYPDKLVTLKESFSPITEAYRSIRSNIHFMAVDRPLTTLLVTSAAPGEGKSVTVANLGIIMAQAGLKTVIVDADLRRPTQHEIFQLAPNLLLLGGLTELICTAEAEADSYLRPTGVENLFLIPSGVLPPNPAELLGSQRMAQVLAGLSQVADVVIMDSPPATVVTDAVVLSTRADGVIMVVKAGHTRLAALGQLVAVLNQAGARLLGGILNQSSPRKGGGYYYYYQTYYSPRSPGAGKGAGSPLEPGRSRRWQRLLPFFK